MEKQLNNFLVGGAVRDILMGLTPKDRDWVVVGSSPEEMLARGFKAVGADFPVFLHPETGEEYALARTERKVGEGYNGFETVHDSSVTLEADCARRDLTINAMAMDTDFEGVPCVVHDFFGGQKDIKDKILRHTSEAFAEDPVRVLRIARLKARFGPEWQVAPETKVLVSKMAKKGVLGELTAERVWKELSRALLEPHPDLFFETLLEIDAVHVIFPVIFRLKQTREAIRWHPEGDSWNHTMAVLKAASKMKGGDHDKDLHFMMAALVHDFGKVLTPWDKQPAHHGHDVAGIPLVADFCDRYTVPAKMKERLMKATRFHMRGHDLDKLKPSTVVQMFDSLGVLNDPFMYELMFVLFDADNRGRWGSENELHPHLPLFVDYHRAYCSVKYSNVFKPEDKPSGEHIKQKLFQARVAAVTTVKKGKN